MVGTKEKNDADSDDDQNWPREKSGAQAAYDYSNITNSDDWEIRNDLDDAHERLHVSFEIKIFIFCFHLVYYDYHVLTGLNIPVKIRSIFSFLSFVFYLIFLN